MSGNISRRILLLGVLVACGCCGNESAPQDAAGTPGASAPTADVDLRIVDEAGYKAVIEENRGKVILVDFWAAYCLPCLETMPHTVKLGQRLEDQGLVVVLMSLDPTDSTEQAKKMLAERGATTTINLQSTEGGSDTDFEIYDITNGALPHVKIYNREGEIVKTFGGDIDNPYEHKDVAAAAEEALKG